MSENSAPKRSRLRVKPSLIEGLRLVWSVDRRRANLLAFNAVVLGVIPVTAIMASGVLVGAVPQAAQAGGLDSAPGRRVLLGVALVALAFIVREVLATFQAAQVNAMMIEVEAGAANRTMAALLYPATIRHLEDPAYRDVVSLATNVTWPNRQSFTEGFFGVVSLRVQGLVAAVLVARFHPLLAAVLALAWLTVGHHLRKTLSRLWGVDGGFKTRRAMYYRTVALEPQAAKEVRVFGLTPWIAGRFSSHWFDAMEDVWRNRRQDRRILIAAVVSIAAVNGWAFWLVAEAARQGRLAPGALAVVAQSIFSLAQLGSASGYDVYVGAGAASMPGVVTLERAVREDPNLKLTGDLPAAGLPQREIRFERVRFTYPGRDTPVYDGLDLVIPAGRSLAIVGANGAGKTTLIKLLARLYDASEGAITVDGVDVRQLDPHQWQRQVAAIFQDFTKYEMSVADNVGFGAIEHRDEPEFLARALDRAGATDLVDQLDDGLDTVLSRRFKGGTDLSGGQWQRVALARAVAAVEGGAGVLILDEPTAHLDVRAEVELFDRFLEVTRDATTILISHRFSTVRRADRIVVLDSGRVIEDGTHEELLAARGRYARMFTLQAERYQSGAPELDDDELIALAGSTDATDPQGVVGRG